ncbi:transmembrane 9 superfamily member 5-like [Malania oleifera]|uniref:transmembrane 9 superfamily member 5-like n=1 Tax=Malania oleifera TaxID=397392 RepID=UPI0025AE165F|nr:transmembrane 9 superfamily member 5-like [Malania oleifera]
MTETPGLRLLLGLFLTTLGFPWATLSSEDHRYNVGDDVPLFVNKVGPLNNPSETYQYFDWPFCCPDPIVERKESLGEVLNGDRLNNALYELKFREDKIQVPLCQKKLGRVEAAKFRDAVANDFYFQMYCDDLPFWGFIGKVEDEKWSLNEKSSKYYLFKHVRFDAFYNGNQIIEIRAFSDPNYVVDISEDTEINVEFSYSVFWNATSTRFENRMEKYSKASLLPAHQQIHWFAIVNSVVIILLLMGLLILHFMRHLKSDLQKCSSGDEQDKEAGWTYIHGDVFRYPSYTSLFCAVMGTGVQLLTLVFFLFILAFVGILYPYSHGALCTSLVIIYSLTSIVAGYTASAFHNQFADTGWERSVLLSGILYPGPLFLIMLILNTVAMISGSTTALPLGTIVLILTLYIFVTIPLLALGGVIGYRFRSECQAPCATKRCSREIPSLAWYRRTPSQMFIAGLVPFSAIVLELHHLYASLWGYKICTVSSILFVMFIILIVLTALLSVGLTYIQLSMEDHKWWWSSVLRGGSTAFFMYAYCVCYYAKSNMSGFMQLSYFFGCNACMCYAFFLMLGVISFCASSMFVSHIYHVVKSE